MPDRPYENREIDAKFKYIAEKLELIHTSMTDHKNDMDKRVGVLEEWKSDLMGRIAIVTIIGGALWAAAVAWITKRFF